MNDGNDLDDIFEEYENADGQELSHEPENEGNQANGEQSEGQTREVVPVPKRVVRNPRLKFNADRLCGERGIPVLTKHFKNVKFKGKGHEKEDLNKFMSHLEHWSHRLFPSMKFEACLRQIEKLGKKRAVQTCLVKIRRDMPILKDDFVHDDAEDERDEMMEMEALPPEDAFDRLFQEDREQASSSRITATPQSSGAVLGSSFGSSLTEEQRQRMEYNKLLATERRKAKMAATTTVEDSGRLSPSLMDQTFDGSRETQPNLEQQFDSLFENPSQENTTQQIVTDSNLGEYQADLESQEPKTIKKSVSDDQEANLEGPSLDRKFDSLFEVPSQDTPTQQIVTRSDLDGDQKDSENQVPKSIQESGFEDQVNLERSSLDNQFESIFHNPSEDIFSDDASTKTFSEAQSTCESSLKFFQQGPSLDDSVKCHMEPTQGGSGNENSEKLHASLEISNPEDSSRISVKDKNGDESSENNPCVSSTDNVVNANEAEELGLDELMDLVDDEV